MRQGQRVFFAAIIFFMVCGFTSVCFAGLSETAKIVPPETVVLMEVDDFSQLKTQFEKTSLHKLYKDPSMAAFVGDAKEKLKKKAQELDGNNFLKMFYDADVMPSKKLALAVVLTQQINEGNEPSMLLVSEWGGGVDKLKAAVEKMVQKNSEMGGHKKKSESYYGVDIETLIDEGSSTMYHCFIDDAFLVATGLETLKFAVAHIKGASSPALWDDADYKAAKKSVGPYDDVSFYVNIKQIIKASVAEDTTGKTLSIITNLGFDNVTSLASSLAVGRLPGSPLAGKTVVKIAGAKKGVCKMLEMESAAVNVPAFISTSAYATTFLNLDITKVYNELYNVLYSFAPQYAAMMFMPLLPPSPQGEPGVQLKGDIIDHLGSQILLAQNVNKPISKTSKPEYLVGLATNNRGALERSLSLLHSKMIAPNDPDASRELLGHTIYTVSFPGFPFLPGGMAPMQNTPGSQPPQMAKLAFTVTDTHLIFGLEDAVERAIRTLNGSSASSMGSTKWFKAAKATVPSVSGMAAFEDSATSFELLWQTLKQNAEARKKTAATAHPQIGFNVGMTQFVECDVLLLPKFDSVRKYFGLSSSYGLSTPDGFFFEFKCIDGDGDN